MAELPPGRMDEATKRELMEAAKRTPWILFRAWTNEFPPSGGRSELNMERWIKPLAFALATGNAHRCEEDKTIYDLTRDQLCDMCYKHLNTLTSRNFYTEFSSWASSLQVAIRFAGFRGGQVRARDYYISVIDTRELPNVIFHVPSLAMIRGAHKYGHEYLAHGVIRGTAHKAVRLQAMLDIGVVEHFQFQTRMSLYTAERWLRFKNNITLDEYDNALSVARQYGPKFGAAVMVAILCLKQRDGSFWRNGTNGVEYELNEYLLHAGFDIPDNLCADASIMTDIVYTYGYENVEQMIRMLRAIVNLRFGP